jgi:triosephosphate isomerase (TIM)
VEYTLIANWKMNCVYNEAMNLGDFYKAHLNKKDHLKLIACPPAIWLESLAKKFKNSHIGLGAQNIHYEKSGAFTGEISAPMVKKFAKYVIVGHSERRKIFHETDEAVNQKLKIAIDNGLIPVVCYGEDIEEEGIDHILAQISKATEGVPMHEVKKIIFAYEPVWAIGTGKVATANHARTMIDSSRERLAVKYSREIAGKAKFLYGGSVHSKNIHTFLEEKTVNGFLVGGASLDVEVFGKIYNILSK